MKTRDFLALTVLAAVWGASFLFMRVSTPYLGPFATIWVRVSVAALALWIGFMVRGKKVTIGRAWGKMILVGAINAAIPFTLISAATLTLPASTASVINATTPLFAAIMAWLVLKESLKWNHFLAFACGIGGVIALLGWSPLPFTHEVVLAAMMSLGASMFYGIGGVYVKKHMMGFDGEVLSFGQQAGAAIVLFPMIFIQPPATWSVPFGVWLAVIVLGVVCTSFAYLIYFSLIRRVGPTKTLSVTFMVPFFGVLWGAIFLHEALSLGTFLGFGLILASLMILSEGEILGVKRKERA